MVVAHPIRGAVRPACPHHPGSRVRLDGYVHSAWSEAHRRPRYRCVTEPTSRGHVFSLPIPVRQPSEQHPDSGATCPRCEHAYERHEGVRTGRDFVFGHVEIARLFLRIGEGMSLRDASAELRRSVFRVGRPSPADAAVGHDWPDETSRQANLAVNYLDAFAPVVIAALHPRTWPQAIVVDSTTLMTRGYRRVATDVVDGGPPGGEAEQRVGNLKAGTILAALDPTGPGVVPCLIEAHGGKDVESWKAFFGGLAGAPDWVVADLDPAIARAVRETWPGAILYHSRHHLAELMRGRAAADGIEERIELDEPTEVAHPIPWAPTRQTVRRYGEHPLFTAIGGAQRGPDPWARLKALVEEHVAPDRLELRSWIATNELLIERQWRIARVHDRLPRSTGGLEGKIGEWLAPLRRRAGRWQNVRRLNLVLGLMTLRGRGEAHEARYAGLIRARFCGHRSALAPARPERAAGRDRRWQGAPDELVADVARSRRGLAAAPRPRVREAHAAARHRRPPALAARASGRDLCRRERRAHSIRHRRPAPRPAETTN